MMIDKKNDLEFDMHKLEDPSKMKEMMEKMEAATMERARQSPAYVERVIGLAEEAMERKLI